jgi:RHS repeat-associated protein
MGEKFAANLVTGTGSMTVPIATSPPRSGFGPQLALSYDSGAGNGPYGFGWSLSLPSVTRKTDRGLPRYEDADESDVFILSGAEDLVPVLIQQADGQWVPELIPPRNVNGKTYRIDRYRPRIEGLFARIERWTNTTNATDIFWRSISKDNITTFYGKTDESRIANPEDPSQIFSWLICQSYDDKGNAIVYKYDAENEENVDLAEVNERNRVRTANRYVKRIKYGNRTPNRDPDTWQATDAAQLPASTWMFEVVFDYEDGHYQEQQPDANERIFAQATIGVPPNSSWPVRLDPFSSYRAGFEVRTYRLCRRALMFHHFPQELGINDCLVRSTEFSYSESPIASFVSSVTQSGYVRQPVQNQPNRYLKKSLPPLEFEYSEATLSEEVQDVDPESLQNLPVGANGAGYQWLDLDGEGLQCVLAEQEDGWYYKRNVSPRTFSFADGKPTSSALFDPVTEVATLPSFAESSAQHHQFFDLAGDGQLDCVVLERPVAGFFERTYEQGWEAFKPLPSLPNLDWGEPNLRFVDLTGDGHADILITEENALTWYPSLAEEGFGTAIRVPTPRDEEEGPAVVFADATQAIFTADLSGDGLIDIVRIRNGEVCYWPNLGYGRFGAKVTMDNAPWFDAPDQFDPSRVRLADIDGSGTTDIIYLERNRVAIYRNECGNSWSSPEYLESFPSVDDLSAVTAVDLLGNGTACLVWSSPLAGNANRQMRYIDLMGGQKPHLLIKSKNNLGAETVVQYAPSTKFYLQDKLDGKPWITRLPFPVHCVERVETYDRIGGNRFVSRFGYHHGHFDGVEREFRGFGMVEQTDTEEIGDILADETSSEATNLDEASFVPPIRTKTWFHTGVYDEINEVSQHFAAEYYGAPPADDPAYQAKFSAFKKQFLLDDTILPDGLTAEEEREASRALKGAMLRQEVYGLDGTVKEKHPYIVTEQNFTIERLQPQGNNRHAVFFTHAREALSYHYERNPDDPRIGHAITLEADKYGNVLKSVAIGYGRKQSPLTEQADREKQTKTLITYTENDVTVPIDDTDHLDDYRTPLSAEARSYELTDYPLTNANARFQISDFVQPDPADPTGHKQIHIFDSELKYEESASGGRQRRLIERVRTLYRKDDLTGLLPLGQLELLALPGESYKLAFTPSLLTQIYRRPLSVVPPPNSPPPEVLLPGNVASLLGSTDPDGGGYVDLDGDNHWWIPSGHIFFSTTANVTNPATTAAAELGQARQHFFLPRKFSDPFDQSSMVDYDDHHLLIVKTEDALQNTVTALQDYRVLQPRQVTDPNENRLEAAFDALGLVVAMAARGKAIENLGDLLEDFEADPPLTDVQSFIVDPRGRAATLLGKATTRIVYDLDRFRRCAQPPFACALARETHFFDPGGSQTKIQISFSYSDGFGREIQKKIQAESGDAPTREANLSLPGGDIRPGKLVVDADDKPIQANTPQRWVGTGRTVFNNKGKPVRQYEPFFSTTHLYEEEPEMTDTGVSPILFYDPAERVVATLHPNHAWEKVVFDPWQQTTFGVNDTVAPSGAETGDLRTDTDIQGYVAEYFKTQPDDWQTWYAQRVGGEMGSEEQDASNKAAIHAATPTVAHFDTLGRTFLTIAHNKFKYTNTPPADPPIEKFYPSRVELDIEGNQRAVRDTVVQNDNALGRIVMIYEYDMLGTRIHQASMEAGERWILNDVTGKPIRAWDSRGHQFRTAYDPLRRPTDSFLREGTEDEVLVGRSVYGETRPNPEANNLRGKVVEMCDQAGVVTTDDYDFKGNLLRSQRQLAQDYKKTLDWSAVVQLEAEFYTSRTRYDALNRPTQVIAPHSDEPGATANIIEAIYNEANLLEQVHVWLNQNVEPMDWLEPSTANVHAVTNIDYNAKGQRELIAYGNGATTAYEYDPLTFRLIRLRTTRLAGVNGLSQLFTDPKVVQDLHYTYDPAGNITRVADTALARLSPSVTDNAPFDYTYDAIYRLIEATGREHVGQTAHDFNPQNRRDYDFVGLAHPDDLQAMRRYTERYQYDAVGNFEFMRHIANGGSWTRGYEYNEASLIEPWKQSNRLTQMTVGNGVNHVEPYTYKDVQGNDADGFITAINSMLMEWDFKDQLHEVDLGGGGTAYYVYGASGQRVRKVIEQQNGERKEERIYLGGFEIYRGFGANALTRETLHIMDDKQRIALVETKTIENGNPINAAIPVQRYQLGNHLGSAILELDKDGGLISYEEYHPYGTTAFQVMNGGAEVSLKRYRCTAKERDEETGFYYQGARYYLGWLGRWLSADPIGIKGGLNTYVYTADNPTNMVDPAGTQPHPGPGMVEDDPELSQVHAEQQERADEIADRALQDIALSSWPDVGVKPPTSDELKAQRAAWAAERRAQKQAAAQAAAEKKKAERLAYEAPPVPDPTSAWDPATRGLYKFLTEDYPVLGTIVEGIQFSGSVMFFMQDASSAFNSLRAGMSSPGNAGLMSPPLPKAASAGESAEIPTPPGGAVVRPGQVAASSEFTVTQRLMRFAYTLTGGKLSGAGPSNTVGMAVPFSDFKSLDPTLRALESSPPGQYIPPSGVVLTEMPSRTQFAALTKIHGTEFALTYNQGTSEIRLFQGDPKGVSFTAGGSISWLAHTHPMPGIVPGVYPWAPSAIDVMSLNKIGQTSSVIVMSTGEAFTYGW